MQSSVRPWFTAGVASLGAAALVAAPLPPLPILPTTTVPGSTVVASDEVALRATILDILTFPTIRQAIINRVDDILTLAAGLSVSSAALVNALVAFPQQLALIIEQILDGNPLGALDTIEAGLLATSAAVILPTWAAVVENNRSWLEVQLALETAVPQALVEFGTGFFVAGDAIARATIIGIQNLVAAILPLDIGNIVDALVSGTVGFVDAVGTGTQAIIDGIAAAQQTLAEAYAAHSVVGTNVLPDATVFRTEVTALPDGASFTAVTLAPESSGPTDISGGAPPAGKNVADQLPPPPPPPAPAPAPAPEPETPTEPAPQEPTDQGTGDQDTGNEGTGNQDTGNDGSSNEETVKDESGSPTENEPAPKADITEKKTDDEPKTGSDTKDSNTSGQNSESGGDQGSN